MKTTQEKARHAIEISNRLHMAFSTAIEKEMRKARKTCEPHEFLTAVVMSMAATASASFACFAPSKALAGMCADELHKMVKEKTREASDALQAFKDARGDGPLQ